MDSRYNYDENSETWPVFALAVASVAVVPWTLSTVYTSLFTTAAEDSSKTPGQIHALEHSPEPVRQFRKKKTTKSWLTSKKFWFLVLGWVVIGSLLYKIHTTEIVQATNVFDPYELLGIEYGTSDKDIKSHYRKLTIKFHPDKIRNKSEEEMKELEQRFVLITKAYKALTDEVTKENYEKYGHPDGPQQASHGIALPKFLIEGNYSPALLALYLILIGAVLPYVVNSWWTKSKKITKKGIHAATAEGFVENVLNWKPSEIVKIDTILTWLSDADEYKDLFPGKSSRDILKFYDNHLHRLNLEDNEQLEAIAIVPTLINGLVDISSSFRNTEISLVAIETLKHFIQALPESPYNHLLQLPNVNPKAVADSKIIRLGKLLSLTKDQMKTKLGIKDDETLMETLDVASKIPILRLLKAEFQVPGETVVTPASTCHITLKVLIKSAYHSGKVEINESRFKESQDLESLREPFKIVHEQPILPKAYAPFFPLEKESGYIGFVILQKDGKISESPVLFKNLDLSNLELSKEEYLSNDGELLKIGTLKIPIAQPTPAQQGEFQFRVVVKSLDYFTPDIDTSVVMKVQDPPQIEEIEQEAYDIPDPKEDSIAGAMATMRGEKVEKIRDEYQDSEDEDSDFEDEEDEDFTDINTDTEDEGDEN